MQPKLRTWYINSLSTLFSLPSHKFSSFYVPISCCIAITLPGCSCCSRSFLRMHRQQSSAARSQLLLLFCYQVDPEYRANARPRRKVQIQVSWKSQKTSLCISLVPVWVGAYISNQLTGVRELKLLIGLGLNHTFHLWRN